MKIKIAFLVTALLFFIHNSFLLAGTVRNPERKIVWEGIRTSRSSDHSESSYLSFKGATYGQDHLPQYLEQLKLSPGIKSVTAEISNVVYTDLTAEESRLVKRKNKDIHVDAEVGYVRKVPIALIHFVPIRMNPSTGKYERLVTFNLTISPGSAGTTGSVSKINGRLASLKSQTYAPRSVLSQGAWYRIGLTQDGVYKISYSFLKKLGLNMKTTNANNIRIYGNGGGQLPYGNSAFKIDDLAQNAICVYGIDSNKNNPGQIPLLDSAKGYILFFGQSQTRWTYNPDSCPKFRHSKNLFSDTTYYFITADAGPGKRIAMQPSSIASQSAKVNTFDDYTYTEDDAVNLIQSGRQWYGANFDIVTSYNYSYLFPVIDSTNPATVNISAIGRYDATSTYQVSVNSPKGTVSTFTTPSVPTGNFEESYAATGNTCFQVIQPINPISVTTTLVTPGAEGWLTFIEVNARRQLSMNGAGVGDQLLFRDSKSIGTGKIAQYNLTTSVKDTVWEVTDPTNVKQQVTTFNGSTLQFTLAADSLRQFVAFNGNTFYTPLAVGPVANQNLHGLPPATMFIVTHPLFLNEANTLAEFHQNNDNLSVQVVTTQQIYNEFSSGAQDVTAIKDFVKMFYDRAGENAAQMPQYLLLFGSGSYDNLYRTPVNTDFIPTYQSADSWDPEGSYVSDDYYGLLDPSEGDYNTSDLLDIGIGRIPCINTQQAQSVVNKIIKYSTKAPLPAYTSVTSCINNSNGSVYGPWRNTICFVADIYSGDGSAVQQHEMDAESEASIVNTYYRNMNINKIYLDDYPDIQTPGGDSYPGAEAATDAQVNQGALIVNYNGHGGQLGWSHSRFIGDNDIDAWSNINTLPLFMTATCQFGPFDNPAQTSAGELVLLNPSGGGIGLFTTCRLTDEGDNKILNLQFYEHILDTLSNGQLVRLGDVFRITKDSIGYNLNARNFTFLGDPAVRMAYPKYNIQTDSINGIKLGSGQQFTSVKGDTLRALSKVTVSGHLTDNHGNALNTFSGYVYPQVYDKPISITTLGSQGAPPFTFNLQNNVLYKGLVTVTNGKFHFTFIVPKDIAYNYGQGRISYYGENGTYDATGNCEKFLIGGTASNPPIDNLGPGIKLYLNDTKFVYGGITDANPYIYATLKDSSGINTVSNGIGHDLTAIIDGNTSAAIILNDYYQADINSYKSGSIHYQLQNLSPGTHTLTLKAWDIYDNSSTATTEFVVTGSSSLGIAHVLNYPDPFTTHTQFFFEDNRCCEQLDVQIEIFTVSGKEVRNIVEKVTLQGFRSDPIDWDGRDDFGNRIGKGVYVYHLKVKGQDGSQADTYQKLVIL